MNRRFAYVLGFVTVALSVDTCVKKGPCVCENSKGVVNLTALAKSDGNPRFQDVPGSETQNFYSWNPCYGFNEGPKSSAGTDMQCLNVAVCWSTHMIPRYYYNLGEQSSATFSTASDGTITVSYIHTLSETGTTAQRKSNVQLICTNDDPGVMRALGEQPAGSKVHNIEYSGKYSCPGGKSSGSNELSIGSVLCIIFFVVLIVYVTAGLLFQVFYRKSSGKEIIPNLELWETFGENIKGGCTFTFCWHRSKYEST